jgi:hypothetical protein
MPTSTRRPLHIHWPVNGDILNRHDGTESRGALSVEVRGWAPPGAEVRVNGLRVTRVGESFRCNIPLRQRENRIVATAQARGRRWHDAVTVLWDKGSRKRYRFSIDDNIQFLKDLGLGNYDSLFDHWYMAFWREMHRRFGAKIHINIYYQTAGFNLTQMPERYKGEWQANADWLRLTFHALQDKPDRIYQNATYEQMARDFDLVTSQIRRFAGEELLSTFTTVHWAEAPREACRALHDRGIRGLIGGFWSSRQGYRTMYYLDLERAKHAGVRDYWKDLDEDFIFVRCDAVINNLRLVHVRSHLDAVAQNAHQSELMELLIHEQYFRPDLPRHFQPDVQRKVIAALEWVTERNYRPVFWGDGFLGSAE